jgi:hypothetical protein
MTPSFWRPERYPCLAPSRPDAPSWSVRSYSMLGFTLVLPVGVSDVLTSLNN